jgi:hypothetical protein
MAVLDLGDLCSRWLLLPTLLFSIGTVDYAIVPWIKDKGSKGLGEVVATD